MVTWTGNEMHRTVDDDTSPTTYQLAPGDTLTLEVRRDPVLWAGLALALVAVLVALAALMFAVKAQPAEPATSPATSSAVAQHAAHRGGPSVVLRKVRRCYTFPSGYRVCTVQWVRVVRHRSTVDEFRARIGYRA